MSGVTLEMQLVDLSDDELRERLLKLHECLKRIEEAKKSDRRVARIKELIKKRQDRLYNNEMDALRLELKAARAHAKLRGLSFKLEHHEIKDT